MATGNVSYIIELKDKFSGVSAKFNDSLEKISKRIKDIDKRMKALGEKFSKIGKTMMTRITLPLTGIGVASVAAFSKLEKGLVNTLTLLDDAQVAKYGESLKKAQQDALKMGFSIEDVNEALFDTVSALGISENTTRIFSEAQKLAIGGNARLGDAILGIGKVINIYGEEVADATTISNALFTAQKVGVTNVAALAQNIPKVAGTAKFAGLSVQEMASALSVLTKVTSNTEEASVAMVAILKTITKPAVQSEKIFKKLGITYGATNVQQTGFSTILRQISKAMKTNADELARAIPELNAFKGLANLSEESLKLMDDTVLKINKDIKEGTGINKAFNKQIATMDTRLKQAKGSLIVAAKLIGVELAPFVLSAANKIKNLADKFSNLSPFMKKFIIILSGVLLVSGPILIFLGSLFTALGLIAAAGVTVKLAFGWVFGIVVVFTALWKIFKAINKQLEKLGTFGDVVSGALFPLFKLVNGIFSGKNKLDARIGNIGEGASVNKEKDIKGLSQKVFNSVGSDGQEIKGNITVRAEKGTEVTSTFSSSRNIGLNALPSAT